MLQEIDLRELSQLQGQERAFVSFYASDEAGLRMLDARERRIRDMLDDQPDELEHFNENMRLLRKVLEQHEIEREGICVFVCFALDFVRGYQLSAEAPNLLRIGAAPYIRPLARLQDEYEDFLVAAADNKSTRIFHVAASDVEIEEKIRGDVKNHVRKGGWSQQRYSRRRDQQLHHYAKEIADVLGRLCREEGIDRLVLLGSQETIGEIEGALPDALAAKVVGAKAVDLHEGQDELIRDAYDLFFEEEHHEEQELWERIRSAYFSGKLAAVGAEEVLQAAMIGRVDTLAVNRDVKLTGGHCRECDNIMPEEAETCAFCGADSVFPIDLVDKLVRQMELTSAEIEFVDPPLEALEKVGGVAALLRY